MRRKAYGRDFGLSSRMFLTMFLLGRSTSRFFVVLDAALPRSGSSDGADPRGLAFLQYFTSDKIALAASGAKVVTPSRRRSCTPWSTGSAPCPTCPSRASP